MKNWSSKLVLSLVLLVIILLVIGIATAGSGTSHHMKPYYSLSEAECAQGANLAFRASEAIQLKQAKAATENKEQNQSQIRAEVIASLSNGLLPHMKDLTQDLVNFVGDFALPSVDAHAKFLQMCLTRGGELYRYTGK